jgi:hypothetical protein
MLHPLGRSHGLWSLAACALAVLSAGAQDRPLLTESARTAPGGTKSLEAGMDFVRDEPNFLTGQARDRYDGPVVRLVYSPADNVELDVEWTARVGVRDDPDFGSVSDWGDVALRAKVRLAGGDGRGYALGARFGVTLPETSFGDGLGPNALRTSAQLLWTAGAGGTDLHLNAGLAIHDDPLQAHEQRDFLHYGAAVVHRLGGGLSLLGEVSGLAGRGRPGADARAEARVGVRAGGGRTRWDVALRRGLAEADGTWGLTAGVAWTSR